MGCGVSARAASEYQRVLEEIAKMRVETEEAEEEREVMEGEIDQLRRQLLQLTEENEFLKARTDRLLNYENPCIFEDSKAPDELIANWVEMDLRDGDELLAALARVHPESEPDVRKMLDLSASIRHAESTLQEYCNYFSTRFKLYNDIWAKVVGVHFVLDDSFKGMREAVAQGVQSVESIVGKKSETMDKLRRDVRDLFKLKYGDFLIEYRRITTFIETTKIEHLQKKLEEKEAEKQRLMSKYESDLKSISSKHASDLEMHQTASESLRSHYEHTLETQQTQFNLTLAQLQSSHSQEMQVRYDTESHMKSDFKRQIERIKRELKEKNEEIKKEFEDILEKSKMEQKQGMEEIVGKCKENKELWEKKIEKLQQEHQMKQIEAENRLNSCISENKKRIAEMKETHKKEKLDMIGLVKSWKNEVKQTILTELSTLNSEIIDKNAEIALKLQIDHEKYIEKLKSDKIIEMDTREKDRSAELLAIIRQFGETFDSFMSLNTQKNAEALDNLSEFHLKGLGENLDLISVYGKESEVSGLESGLTLYSNAVNQLKSALKITQNVTETVLDSHLKSTKTLVNEYLNLKDLQTKTQIQLENDTKTYQKSATELENRLQSALFLITEKDIFVTKLKENIKKLEKEIEIASDSHYQENAVKSQKRLFVNYMKKILQVKRSFMFKWRMKAGNKPIVEEPAPVPEDSEEEDDSDMQHIEQILKEDKQALLDNNVVVEAYRNVGKQEKPLTAPQVIKFFEEMLDQKYDADRRDLKNQKPLKPLPDFMLDHMNRQFGLKKLAQKNLCQFMAAIQGMYEENEPAYLLMCRFMQILHPDPVTYLLGIFLTRIRVEFVPFMEKYQKDREARESRRNLGKKDMKSSSNPLSCQEAYLVDIIGYIYSLFENDRRSGELMLKLLQPTGVGMIDYLTFKLCHKMAKLGLNVDGLFSMLDPHGFGYIDERDFVTKSRRELEMWISGEDLSTLFRHLSDGQKEINRGTFTGKVNVKVYLEHCKSDLYVVTRQQFLICLIEVYNVRQRRDGVFIKNKIGGDAFFTHEQVIEKLTSIEPTLDPEKAETLYQEALSYSPDPVSGIDQRSLLRTILHNPLGPMKKSAFCKFHADKEEVAEILKIPNSPRRMSMMPPDASPLPRRQSMMVTQIGSHGNAFSMAIEKLLGANRPEQRKSVHEISVTEENSQSETKIFPEIRPRVGPKIVISTPEEFSESSPSEPCSPTSDVRRPELSLSIPNLSEIVEIEKLLEEKEERPEKQSESPFESDNTDDCGARESETPTEASRPTEGPAEDQTPKSTPAPSPVKPLELLTPPADTFSPICLPETRPDPPPSKMMINATQPIAIPIKPSTSPPPRKLGMTKPPEKPRSTSTTRGQPGGLKKAGLKPGSPKATYAPKPVPAKSRR